MYECGTCGKEFYAGWQARDNHCRSTGHRAPEFECDTCDRYFASEQSCLQHMDAKNHHFNDDHESSEYSSESSDESYEEWCCDMCSEYFDTEEKCHRHEIVEHFYCSDCGRSFVNYKGIKNHLDSSLHSDRVVKCPLCTHSDANASAIAMHIERGWCPGAPNMDRDEMYRMVRSKDPKDRISRRSIFGDLAGAAPVKFAASETAWTGKGYECYFCHEKFGSLNGLNCHLNSDTHQEVLYHCPKSSCPSEFKTLAAVINHLESETCGAMRFDTVQRRIGDIVSGNRLLCF
ncbi:hypothetical protein C8A01DRAFT_48822 [Parachaetomium inaequale]|uniref:C2H2-type domain-containing protein n=1 Tax=Parachaetomium inaequale TaxID=2588326 RepID=A0AAN6SPF3_9PEZI|nr:hypothetical protein C8A01DRAFT_48822 [Parachaetomium inaequale]